MPKWTTSPPPDNGAFFKDKPDRYVLCGPRTNAQGYPEYDPSNIRFLGTHNECFAHLHKNQNHSIDYALKHGGWCWLYWSEYRFPSRAPMISHSTPQEAEEHFKRSMQHYDATSADIVLEDMFLAGDHERRQGFRSKYTLKWLTYKGWKVYMLMTGCYASIPEYEPKEPDAVATTDGASIPGPVRHDRPRQDQAGGEGAVP